MSIGIYFAGPHVALWEWAYSLGQHWEDLGASVLYIGKVPESFRRVSSRWRDWKKTTFWDWSQLKAEQLKNLRHLFCLQGVSEEKKRCDIPYWRLALWEEWQGPQTSEEWRGYQGIYTPLTAAASTFREAQLPVEVIPWVPEGPFWKPREMPELDTYALYWPITEDSYDPELVEILARHLQQKNFYLSVSYPQKPNDSLQKGLQRLYRSGHGKVELYATPSFLRQRWLCRYNDLVLWPVRHDPTGAIPLTAFSVSTPVITYDHPSVAEWVHDQRTGCLAPCELDFSPAGLPLARPDATAIGQAIDQALAMVHSWPRWQLEAYNYVRMRQDRFRNWLEEFY